MKRVSHDILRVKKASLYVVNGGRESVVWPRLGNWAGLNDAAAEPHGNLSSEPYDYDMVQQSSLAAFCDSGLYNDSTLL